MRVNVVKVYEKIKDYIFLYRIYGVYSLSNIRIQLCEGPKVNFKFLSLKIIFSLNVTSKSQVSMDFYLFA